MAKENPVDPDKRAYFHLIKGEAFDLVTEFIEEMKAANKLRNAFEKEVGGSIVKLGESVAGIAFKAAKAPANNPAWRFDKRYVPDDGELFYAPARATKPGRELAKRLATMDHPDSRRLGTKLGLPMLMIYNPHGRGFLLPSIGFELIKDKIILNVPAHEDDSPVFTPKGTVKLLKLSAYHRLKEKSKVAK